MIEWPVAAAATGIDLSLEIVDCIRLLAVTFFSAGCIGGGRVLQHGCAKR